MTEQTDISAAVRAVPLAQLYLHDMNPRQNGSEEDTAAMAASIAVNGLMQNLMGFADPERPGEIGIVAGGRRLRGLQRIGDGGAGVPAAPIDTAAIPVRVTDDAFLARSWAGAEAATQVALHPADEIRAYAAMADQGNSHEMIARAFAQTEAHVRRRLALAGLVPEALAALRANHISLDVAKALTLAEDHADQLATLTVARAGGWNAARVRAALTPDTVRSDDRRVRYIGQELYRAEGGTLSADLFEDATYLHDEALLQRLFERELTAAAEEMREDGGWQWAHVELNTWASDYKLMDTLERIHRAPAELPEGDAERLEELSEFDRDLSPAEAQELRDLETRATGDYSDEQRETGGIVVLVDRHGEIEVEGAYIRKADKKGAKKDLSKGLSALSGETSAETRGLPANALADLHRIELLALQAALLDKPELVLDLLAWQLERQRPHWSSPFALTLTDQAIAPEAAGDWTIPEALAETSNSPASGLNNATGEAFEAFRAKGKKHRNQVLTRHLTRTLQRPAGEWADLGAYLAETCGAQIRKHWTPDAPTYFARLPAPALEGLWSELTGQQGEDTAGFAKLKKADKAAELARLFSDASAREALGLSREQAERIETWLPAEMEG